MALARKSRRQLFMQIREAMRSTQHLVCKNGTKISCKRCRESSIGEEAVQWLKTECNPCNRSLAKKALYHESHQIQEFRGVRYCTACGALHTTGRSQKLATACNPPPTVVGLRTLSRIRRNILPVGLNKWPEQNNGPPVFIELEDG